MARTTAMLGPSAVGPPEFDRQAKETRSEAQEMMQTYLGKGAEVAQLNKKARNPQVKELIDSVMPIQQRHVKDMRQATLTLAAREDPNEPV